MIMKRTLYGMIILILVGCTDSKSPAELTFSPVFSTQKITCNTEIDIQDKKWIINQLQFYVSNVELKNSQDKWHKISLKITPDQTGNIALLGRSCGETESGNWRLKFSHEITLADYTAIRFSLGVPFEQNHLNPLEQPSPLNVSSMFWVWQTGHKFARIEMSNNNDDWLFHLGSTGCKSPSVMRAPSNACLYTNFHNFEVELDSSNKVIFDLANLLGSLPLSMAASCQSEQNNLACQQLFTQLKQTGEQAIFRVDSVE